MYIVCAMTGPYREYVLLSIVMLCALSTGPEKDIFGAGCLPGDLQRAGMSIIVHQRISFQQYLDHLRTGLVERFVSEP